MENHTILLSKKQVVAATSLSPTTIWRMMKQGTFPKSIQATHRRVAWFKSDIDQWIKSHKKEISQ